MARITVPMYEEDDGTHIYDDPGVPHTVVELNPPHNAVLEVDDADVPMSIEDIILSVSSFAELKEIVRQRQERRGPPQ